MANIKQSRPRIYSFDEVHAICGMMRQWLNEERITEKKKMVSTEDLFVWFKTKK